MLGAEVRVHLCRRPTVRGLPDEVRRPQDERDRHAAPQPRTAEDPGPSVDHEPHGKPGEQEQDRVLGFQPDADDRPDQQPEPLVAGAQDAKHQPGRQRPHEHVVHRRTLEVTHDQQSARGDAQRGERLREARSSELPRHRARHCDDPTTEQRGDGAQAEQRVPQPGAGKPRHQHRDRWLVDVAEVEVTGQRSRSRARRGDTRSGMRTPAAARSIRPRRPRPAPRRTLGRAVGSDVATGTPAVGPALTLASIHHGRGGEGRDHPSRVAANSRSNCPRVYSASALSTSARGTGLAHEHLELADELLVTAQRQPRLDSIFGGRPPQLVETGRLDARELSRTRTPRTLDPPQPQCAVQQPQPRRPGASSCACRPADSRSVRHQGTRHPRAARIPGRGSRRSRRNPNRAGSATGTRASAPARRAGRRLVSPQHFDQSISRHDHVRVDQQRGQHQTDLRAPEFELAALPGDLQWAQDPERDPSASRLAITGLSHLRPTRTPR